MKTYAPMALRHRDSFAMQYTSLILIVLAFTIGALVKPLEQTGGTPEVPPAVVDQHTTQDLQVDDAGQGAVYPENPMGHLSYTNLFEKGSSAINTDRVEALSTVLRSHDLRADIQVFLQQGESGLTSTAESVLLNSFERSIALARALEARGVPPEAYRIRSVELESTDQAQVNFHRELYGQSIEEERDETS